MTYKHINFTDIKTIIDTVMNIEKFVYGKDCVLSLIIHDFGLYH
jgi:hypothetical protein